jgi:hypothetical protein
MKEAKGGGRRRKQKRKRRITGIRKITKWRGDKEKNVGTKLRTRRRWKRGEQCYRLHLHSFTTEVPLIASVWMVHCSMEIQSDIY